MQREQVKLILTERILKQAGIPFHPSMITAPVGAAIGAGLGGYRNYKHGKKVWKGAAKGAAVGGAIGLAAGFAPVPTLVAAAPFAQGVDKGTSQPGVLPPRPVPPKLPRIS